MTMLIEALLAATLARHSGVSFREIYVSEGWSQALTALSGDRLRFATTDRQNYFITDFDGNYQAIRRTTTPYKGDVLGFDQGGKLLTSDGKTPAPGTMDHAKWLSGLSPDTDCDVSCERGVYFVWLHRYLILNSKAGYLEFHDAYEACCSRDGTRIYAFSSGSPWMRLSTIRLGHPTRVVHNVGVNAFIGGSLSCSCEELRPGTILCVCESRIGQSGNQPRDVPTFSFGDPKENVAADFGLCTVDTETGKATLIADIQYRQHVEILDSFQNMSQMGNRRDIAVLEGGHSWALVACGHVILVRGL